MDAVEHAEQVVFLHSVREGPANQSFGLAVALLAIQFVRPEKNLSAGPGKDDFLVRHPAPPEVKRLLEEGWRSAP